MDLVLSVVFIRQLSALLSGSYLHFYPAVICTKIKFNGISQQAFPFKKIFLFLADIFYSFAFIHLPKNL